MSAHRSCLNPFAIGMAPCAVGTFGQRAGRRRCGKYRPQPAAACARGPRPNRRRRRHERSELPRAAILPQRSACGSPPRGLQADPIGQATGPSAATARCPDSSPRGQGRFASHGKRAVRRNLGKAPQAAIKRPTATRPQPPSALNSVTRLSNSASRTCTTACSVAHKVRSASSCSSRLAAPWRVRNRTRRDEPRAASRCAATA